MNALKNLTVLRNILKDEVFALYCESLDGGDGKFAEFVHAFYDRKKHLDGGLNFTRYVEELIYYDNNAVARSFAAGKEPQKMQRAAYMLDLTVIYTSLADLDTRGFFEVGKPRYDSVEKAYSELGKLYKMRGYGIFLRGYAFLFENGELILPLNNENPQKLSALKDYKTEKKLIESNIENFLRGLPYSSMLLYGDRGTGKTSTIHAVAAKNFERGLRIIDLNCDKIHCIGALQRVLEGNPLKFIILIDDLSLSSDDKNFTALKAFMDNPSVRSDNVMIVATSNRRHIVKENFSERQNAVHATDTMQEQLSLSDRFGITVMFSTTGKTEYLSIVRQLAADAGLKMPQDELYALAERWAIVKGGRSPRRAKQIVDLACAAEVKGERIDF